MWEDSKRGDSDYEKLAELERAQRDFSRREEAGREAGARATAPKVAGGKRIRYYVDGERVPPRKASLVAEDNAYMADYIYGKGGRISEIHYDRIQPK